MVCRGSDGVNFNVHILVFAFSVPFAAIDLICEGDAFPFCMAVEK
jgi:hypothetical protein